MSPARWVPFTGTYPHNAVAAGYESNGVVLYIARAKIGNGLYPGKAAPHICGANIGYGGKEHVIRNDFELLVSDSPTAELIWVPFSLSSMEFSVEKETPSICGNEAQGPPLWVARASLMGGMHIGRYGPHLGTGLFPWGGGEHSSDTFQILKILPPSSGANTNGGVDASNPEFKNEVLQLRLNRESAQSGELTISLIWNDIADLDLLCVTPNGELIYYGHKESRCGGWLDVDMNAGKKCSLEPVENIFWASSPSGKYKVFVNNYYNRVEPNTAFTDPHRRVPFRCILKRNGVVETFEGTAAPDEDVTCFEFDHVGTGAVGSFVVLPPAAVPMTFKELCDKHGVTCTQGGGYYAVARKENISADKDLLLQNIEKDTFEIGAKDCRRALGWEEGNISKGPKDIKEGFRLFVQSTSHNRKIPPGTHVLMKVPMKEALAFRAINNSRFTSETHTIGQAPTATSNNTFTSNTTATTTTVTPAEPPQQQQQQQEAPSTTKKRGGKRGATSATENPIPPPAPAPAEAVAPPPKRGRRAAMSAAPVEPAVAAGPRRSTRARK